MARKRGKASTKRSVDFSNVGKPFEKDMDVHLVVKAASWEEGQAGDYLAIEFNGKDEEYENSSIYHNASFSPKALPRTRAFLEALGLEVDGEMEIDAEDLVGLEVMGTTYEDRYDGGKSIKVDEFWPVEEAPAKGGKKSKKSDDEDEAPKKSRKRGGKKAAPKEEPEELDLDAINDVNIKAIGKHLKIKAKKAADIREELADIDEDDIREAAEELEIELPGGAVEEEEDEAPAKKKSGKAGAKSRGGSKKKSATWTSDEIMEMSEEELEEVIEQSDIDVDLDEHKTLRKKKNAVIDALGEAEMLEE
jgi:hypothetical protein